jgi:hypothetical protein
MKPDEKMAGKGEPGATEGNRWGEYLRRAATRPVGPVDPKGHDSQHLPS